MEKTSSLSALPPSRVEEMLTLKNEKVLIDFEIITELRKHTGKAKDGSTFPVLKNILLIENSTGLHIISAKKFDALYIWVAIVYLIATKNQNIIIYGGGHLKRETCGVIEKITVCDRSTTFGGMNLKELQNVFLKIGISVVIDRKYMTSDKKAEEYTLKQLKLM